MDWYNTVFEVIDMRSFSNLWFWVALAIMWSTASHWVLGVPYDMITRSKRLGGQAEVDLHDIVRINANRLMWIGRMSGLWLLGFGCFILTGFALTGFIYGVELSQALFLLGFPMSIVSLLNLSTARLIQLEDATGDLLRKRLLRLRLWTQIIGMISIFVTALWGMYKNLSMAVLG